MGLCCQTIIGDGPEMGGMQKNIETGWVWVCMRRDPVSRKDEKGHDWHIQGVASYEQLAIEMCLDEYHFIGPLPVDVALPYDLMEWPGSYFPYTKEER